MIDTNVLLVADRRHSEVSPECVIACVEHLHRAQKSYVVTVDDANRILREYQSKISIERNEQPGVGTTFLKWLLQNQTNSGRVNKVPLTESKTNYFEEFPDIKFEPKFDRDDRKFVAVAHAHPAKPPIWQAVDSKWLDWWPSLLGVGVRVEFLCPSDVCGFYRHKFPNNSVPSLPPS